MRGAAFLSGLSDAIVLDIGGTTTDGGVLAGGSQARDGVSSMVATAVRLLRDGTLDPAFGVEGKQTYELGLSDEGSQLFTGVALQGGRLVFGGVARRGASGGKDLFVARTFRETIFAAGFE